MTIIAVSIGYPQKKIKKYIRASWHLLGYQNQIYRKKRRKSRKKIRVNFPIGARARPFGTLTRQKEREEKEKNG